jgi:hypothetical protein
MYDYNFPEQLTQERLILLLLSRVIPTETFILKDIYKRKKESEIEDDYKVLDMLRSMYHPEPRLGKGNGGKINREHWAETRYISRRYRKLSYQIRALYPGFIM